MVSPTALVQDIDAVGVPPPGWLAHPGDPVGEAWAACGELVPLLTLLAAAARLELYRVAHVGRDGPGWFFSWVDGDNRPRRVSALDADGPDALRALVPAPPPTAAWVEAGRRALERRPDPLDRLLALHRAGFMDDGALTAELPAAWMASGDGFAMLRWLRDHRPDLARAVEHADELWPARGCLGPAALAGEMRLLGERMAAFIRARLPRP